MKDPKNPSASKNREAEATSDDTTVDPDKVTSPYLGVSVAKLMKEISSGKTTFAKNQGRPR